MKQTIANFLENPAMVDKRTKKEKRRLDKTIRKEKQKDYFSYKHPVSIRNIENAFKEAIAENEKLATLMKKYNVNLTSVQFTRKDEHDELDEIIPPKFTFIEKTRRQLDEEKSKSNERVQIAKDLIYMSNENYEIFRRVSQLDMPSLHVVKTIQEVSNKDQLMPNSNEFGLYFNASDKIRLVVNKKLDKLKLGRPNLLRINIRGDATIVGRNQKFFNFCFNLPDEGMLAKTAFGQYTLGIFELEKENHEILSSCLSGLASHMKEMNNQINISGTTYQIEWSIGGDMAFIHHERGLNACNSNQPCHLCRLHKKEFCKNDHVDIKSKLRSVAECHEFIKKKKGEREGYEYVPIFDFIDYESVHCDSLHQNLRIVNKTLSLLLRKIQNQDGKKSKLLQNVLGDWLKSIGIRSPYTIASQSEPSSELSLRSMTGSQCTTIAQQINVLALFPTLEHAAEIGQIFNNWWRINMGYTHNFYIDKTELLQRRIDEWLSTYERVFHNKECIVYMHHLSAHLSDKISKYGDMDLYNIQGLEKLNDITTTQYFRGTNRKLDYMSQLMSKRIRIEGYILDSIKQPQSEQVIAKKMVRYEYFQNTDLYEITDLSRVPSPQAFRSTSSSTKKTSPQIAPSLTSTSEQAIPKASNSPVLEEQEEEDLNSLDDSDMPIAINFDFDD